MRQFLLKFTAALIAVTALSTSQSFADRRWDEIDNWDTDVSFSHYREQKCGYQTYQGRFGRFDRRMPITGACRNSGDRLAQMTCQYCADNFSHPEQNRACMQAMRDASRFACMREGARGRYDGFYRGATCGIDSGFDDNINDRYATDSGRNSANKFINEITTGARDLAEPMGRNDGVAPGASEALKQFRQAVSPSGGQLPARNSGTGTQYITYSGEADGFARMGHVLRDRADYVADKDLQPYRFFEGRSDSNEYQTYYEDGGRGQRTRQVYKGKGQYYDFQYNTRFSNGFERSSIDSFRRQAPRRSLDYYLGLNRNKISVQGQAPKDAQGNVMKDEKGQPVPPPLTQLDSPYEVYEEAFEEGYRFAGPFMYEKFMRVALDDGFDAGYPAGVEAGRAMAFDLGLRDAYNREFLSESKASYQSAFSSAFSQGYGQSYDDLRSRSRLDEASINSITGELNDGIITPGERAKMSYVVVNIGGQTAAMSAEVNSVPAGSVNVTALTRKEVVTPNYVLSAGALSSNAIDSEQASASLKVINGNQSLSDSISYYVQNIFGIGNEMAAPQNQYLSGQIALPVTVKNPRSVPSQEEAIINLYVNEQLAQTLNVGELAAKSKQDFMMLFSVPDPIAMIGQSFLVRIEIVVDKKIMQSKTAQQFTIDARFGLVEYFGAIINSRGALPPGVTRDQREADLIAKIRAANIADFDSIRAIIEKRDRKEIAKGIPDFLNVKKDAASIMAALGQSKPTFSDEISRKGLAKLAILLEADGKCRIEAIDKILSKKSSSGDYYKRQYADIINDLLDRTGYDNGKLFHLSNLSERGKELQKQLGVEKVKCK